MWTNSLRSKIDAVEDRITHIEEQLKQLLSERQSMKKRLDAIIGGGLLALATWGLNYCEPPALREVQQEDVTQHHVRFLNH